jgi:hypothetical protein
MAVRIAPPKRVMPAIRPMIKACRSMFRRDPPVRKAQMLEKTFGAITRLWETAQTPACLTVAVNLSWRRPGPLPRGRAGGRALGASLQYPWLGGAPTRRVKPASSPCGQGRHVPCDGPCRGAKFIYRLCKVTAPPKSFRDLGLGCLRCVHKCMCA